MTELISRTTWSCRHCGRPIAVFGWHAPIWAHVETERSECAEVTRAEPSPNVPEPVLSPAGLRFTRAGDSDLQAVLLIQHGIPFDVALVPAGQVEKFTAWLQDRPEPPRVAVFVPEVFADGHW